MGGVNGCRALWLGGVSEATFSKDLCTLSGYWTAKFASESSAITATNTLNASAGSGYESLINAVSTVEFAGGATAGADITTTMTLGYANDLVGSSLVNPLGHTGLSYCMCEAILAGCDPKQSGAAIPASPIKTAAFNPGATAEMLLGNYIAGSSAPAPASSPSPTVSNAPSVTPSDAPSSSPTAAGAPPATPSASSPQPLFTTGSSALGREYTGLGVQTLAAMSLTGSTTTIDSERERDAILALGRGLSSKLDKCAAVNIDTFIA